MLDIDIYLDGLEEAQAANINAIGALIDGGSFHEGALAFAALVVLDAVLEYMPWDTGTSYRAQRVEVSGNEALVFTDPSAVNPVSNTPPVEYLPRWIARNVNMYEIAVQEAAAVLPDTLRGMLSAAVTGA